MEQQNSLTLQTYNALSGVVTSTPEFLNSLPEPLSKAWQSFESVMSVEDAVALPNEQKIAKLQQVDSKLTYKSIGRILARMVFEQHIADGLSTANINNIAKRFTTDSEIRWWLTLADVDLLCRRITQGYYGKFYGHFSEGEFYECFVKYCNERRDAHRVEAISATPKMDTSVLADVGYKVGKDGKLIVPEEMQGVKQKPQRFLYDNKGNITGENPAYWAKVHKEKTPEEMEKINQSNKDLERIMQIMDEWGVSYPDAVLLLKKEKSGGKDEPDEQQNTDNND